eukprot:160931_1
MVHFKVPYVSHLVNIIIILWIVDISNGQCNTTCPHCLSESFCLNSDGEGFGCAWIAGTACRTITACDDTRCNTNNQCRCKLTGSSAQTDVCCGGVPPANGQQNLFCHWDGLSQSCEWEPGFGPTKLYKNILLYIQRIIYQKRKSTIFAYYLLTQIVLLTIV